jgi:hypothetical protein
LQQRQWGHNGPAELNHLLNPDTRHDRAHGGRNEEHQKYLQEVKPMQASQKDQRAGTRRYERTAYHGLDIDGHVKKR